MSQATLFDPDLIRRYDGVGPRYTSYPTAPQFNAQFGGTELLKVIAESNEDPIPRALVAVCPHPVLFQPLFLLRL